jgi:hypothetical protein
VTRARGFSGRTAVLALLVAALSSGPAFGPAWAGQNDVGGTKGGYAVEVSVHFSGNGTKGGGSYTRKLMMHPSCWWEPAPGPYTDPKAMLAWYDEVTGGRQTNDVLDEYGPRSAWEAAAKGGPASWYKVMCLDPADYPDYGIPGYEGIDPNGGTPNFGTYHYKAFPAGTNPPPPRVDPVELAEMARDEMEIILPKPEHNPKVQGSGGGEATLVGIPTWFWVGPQALDQRNIHAEVDNGGVAVDLVAKTGGLALSWSGGSPAPCPPDRATKAYEPGQSDPNDPDACTVVFERASPGYRVNASTTWDAHWTSTTAPYAGDVAPYVAGSTVDVPVAEVQNIVTR